MIVLGSLGVAAGSVVFLLGSIGGGDGDAGAATMGGSGAALIGGIVLTTVGAHGSAPDPESNARKGTPKIIVGPAFVGIQETFEYVGWI